jgi:hypothetical protein
MKSREVSCPVLSSSSQNGAMRHGVQFESPQTIFICIHKLTSLYPIGDSNNVAPFMNKTSPNNLKYEHGYAIFWKVTSRQEIMSGTEAQMETWHWKRYSRNGVRSCGFGSAGSNGKRSWLSGMKPWVTRRLELFYTSYTASYARR